MLRQHRLRIALPDNPELETIIEHLRACDFEVPDLRTPGLHIVPSPMEPTPDFTVEEFEIFRLAPADVATYVEHGICHAGVMHTDLLKETSARVWRPFTFPFGGYPIVLAAPRGQNLIDYSSRLTLRIATSLPVLARAIFAARGIPVEVVPVEDSMTACLLGLADGYVDRLTDPDEMVAQGFRAIEVVGEARLKLLANRGNGAARRRAIQKLCELLEEHQPEPSVPVRVPFDDEF